MYDKKMETKAPNLIPCGIEPVDELLGGLERGQSYLVHGEAAGKSLFGIKFLIEGLKRGEHGALVIRYSPEDAVRRFARLGYDCLEDVYSGRLVILEYSDDIIHQVSRLRELTPVLRELEWLLGETRPQRLIFDPVTSLVAGAGNIKARVAEFTEWARSFGATVAFIANGDVDIVDAVKPYTAEVFRFEVKNIGERATRYIVFEKSRIPDQAVEVDPSRGIFLLDRARASEHFFSVFQAAPLPEAVSPSGTEELPPAPTHAATAPLGSEPAASLAQPLDSDSRSEPADSPSSSLPGAMSDLEFDRLLQPFAHMANVNAAPNLIPEPPADEPASEFFADIIEELTRSIAPLDLDPHRPPAATPNVQDNAAPMSWTNREQPATDTAAEIVASPAAEPAPVLRDAPSKTDRNLVETPRRRAADAKIDTAIAARATEVLLRPPDADSPSDDEIEPALAMPAAPAPVTPRDFRVLIIDDDPSSCDAVAQTLAEYTVEIVHDGMSGLAKLISLKPDLVVLSLDLPIIDGFKVLEHIRQGLNLPVILITGTRLRASDRVLAAELGADYYLTKPYSGKELRHKARQLVARYRGLHSWIATGVADALAVSGVPPAEPVVVAVPAPGDRFTPYPKFASQVEEHVRATLDSDATFAIVGCRVPHMTAKGGQIALRLYDLVRRLIRESDLISTNQRNDIVMLLTDANAGGARAFVSRLREGIVNQLNQEPTVWLRTFPDLEEATGAKDWTYRASNGGGTNRRSSDRGKQSVGRSVSAVSAGVQAKQSYIDLLKQM